MLSNTSLSTLQGGDVRITITDDGAVFVNDARVINADILIDNGVLHIIDEVLSPDMPGFDGETDSTPMSLAANVPFTSAAEAATSVPTELAATTSFVAAGLISAMPTAAANGSGNASQTTSSGPAVYTGGAASCAENTVWVAVAGCAGIFAVFLS